MEATFVNGMQTVVVNEMVVHLIVIVEQLNGDAVVRDEAACDERVREALDWHGEVVQVYGGIDVKIFFLTDLLGPRLFREDSKTEVAVVDVDDGILDTERVLLNFLCSNIALFSATNFLLESLLVRLQIVHAHPEFTVISLRNQNGSGGVVRYHAGDDRVLGWHLLVLEQGVELESVVLELQVGLQIFVLCIIGRRWLVRITAL